MASDGLDTGGVRIYREGRRARLRELDACLQTLEDAHERNETLVSGPLAASLSRRVPQIVDGMLIADAIELVLRSQERWLEPVSRPPDEPDGAELVLPAAAPLDAEGARALTEEIRRAANQVCFLLLEAHRRRAWHALGYRTWEQYIRTEFGMSRSRSYEMLDQGRVITALRAAMGSSLLPEISPYTARRIKPHLSEVLEKLGRSVNREMPAAVLQAVSEVIAAHQDDSSGAPGDGTPRTHRSFGQGRGRAELAAAEPGPVAGADLLAAIDLIAGMPPAQEIVSHFPVPDVRAVDDAVRWLGDLAAVLRQRSSFGRGLLIEPPGSACTDSRRASWYPDAAARGLAPGAERVRSETA